MDGAISCREGNRRGSSRNSPLTIPDSRRAWYNFGEISLRLRLGTHLQIAKLCTWSGREVAHREILLHVPEQHRGLRERRLAEELYAIVQRQRLACCQLTQTARGSNSRRRRWITSSGTCTSSFFVTAAAAGAGFQVRGGNQGSVYRGAADGYEGSSWLHGTAPRGFPRHLNQCEASKPSQAATRQL